VRCLGALIAALLTSFALAGPALAADDGTVGSGQVVTDPTAETEPAPDAEESQDPEESEDPDAPVADDGEATETEPPPPDASGQRGEVHVLGTQAHSTTPAPAAASPRPAAAKTLPFTGVDAGALLLVGLALLACGSGLLAVLRQPVQ
jgi:hypothetical protein